MSNSRTLEQIDKRIRKVEERIGKLESHRLPDLSLALGSADQLTIDTGSVTMMKNHSHVRILAEGGVGPDDLDTIVWSGKRGHVIYIRRQEGIEFTAKNGTGNLDLLGGDCVFDSDEIILVLIYLVQTSTWIEVSRNTPGINSSSGVADAGKLVVLSALGTIDKSMIPIFTSFGPKLGYQFGDTVTNGDLPYPIIVSGPDDADFGANVEWIVVHDPTGTPTVGNGRQYVAPSGSVTLVTAGGDNLDLEISAIGEISLTGTLSASVLVGITLTWV